MAMQPQIQTAVLVHPAQAASPQSIPLVVNRGWQLAGGEHPEAPRPRREWRRGLRRCPTHFHDGGRAVCAGSGRTRPNQKQVKR